MTEFRISLSPAGGLRLHIPDSRRFLDVSIATTEKVTCNCCGENLRVPIQPASLRALVKILKDVDNGVKDERGYIGQFPTQAVVDAWLRQDAMDKEERATAAEAARAAKARADLLKKGIDVEKMEFKL